MDNKNKRIEKIYSRKRIKILQPTSIFNNTRDNTKVNLRNIKDIFKIKKIIKIIIVLVIAFVVAGTIMKAIEPIMDAECITMAKRIATNISNEQATKVMENYNYNDLTSIIKDKSGNIQMISANIITVNEIISDIPILIQDELDKDINNKFYIKLGSLTGSKLLAGRGPNIEIKMSSNGNVETDLKSEFSSVGINQTLHRIYLEVRCNVIILTPFNTVEEKIINQVLLAEGIIVGEIPDTYYNLEGLKQEQGIEMID